MQERVEARLARQAVLDREPQPLELCCVIDESALNRVTGTAETMHHQLHHLVAVVDGGPKIVTFITDGRLNDGGDHRQFGWGRFNPNLYHVNGSKTLRIDPSVKSLRLYNRALRVSEVGRRPRAAAGPPAGQPD